jgi:hypothetical protein
VLETKVKAHLALGGQQQIAVAMARFEGQHQVGQEAVQELSGIFAAEAQEPAVGLIEDYPVPAGGSVFAGDIAVGEQRRGFRGGA